MKRKKLLIGIGNRARGDDGAGLEVAQRLLSLKPEDCDVLLADGEPTGLLELWGDYQEILAVDAVVTGQAPVGTVHCWDVSRESLPLSPSTSSSHALGLAEAIELARILQRLPKKIHILGIEAASFNFSETFSPSVERAVERIIESLSLAKGGSLCTNFPS